MGIPIPVNKPIVGKNVFTHESGIHQDGVLKERSTYEVIDPRLVGRDDSVILLGKHSGRHALKVEAENSDMTWMRNVSTSCLMILKSLPTLKRM